MKKTLLLLTILFINILSAQAQKINESIQYHIKPATGEINIDGKRSVPLNDLKAQFQLTEVGWELDNFPDAME